MRASQQVAYVSFVAVTPLDVATNVRLVCLTAMHALHVTKKRRRDGKWRMVINLNTKTSLAGTTADLVAQVPHGRGR